MEGFTIKCDKCGKEVTLKGEDFSNHGIIVEPAGQYGEVKIECDCGLKVVDNNYSWDE